MTSRGEAVRVLVPVRWQVSGSCVQIIDNVNPLFDRCSINRWADRFTGIVIVSIIIIIIIIISNHGLIAC